jgi:hypothetical protein
VDEVPSHEGIQDDVDAAPFREINETLVQIASYLVSLDKCAHRLEDESQILFGDMGTPGSPPTRLTAVPDKWVRPTRRPADLSVGAEYGPDTNQ